MATDPNFITKYGPIFILPAAYNNIVFNDRYGQLLNDFIQKKLIPVIDGLAARADTLRRDPELSQFGQAGKIASLAEKSYDAINSATVNILRVRLKDKAEADKNLPASLPDWREIALQRSRISAAASRSSSVQTYMTATGFDRIVDDATAILCFDSRLREIRNELLKMEKMIRQTVIKAAADKGDLGLETLLAAATAPAMTRVVDPEITEEASNRWMELNFVDEYVTKRSVELAMTCVAENRKTAETIVSQATLISATTDPTLRNQKPQGYVHSPVIVDTKKSPTELRIDRAGAANNGITFQT